jgi:pyrroline-5-carboxylate reductase
VTILAVKPQDASDLVECLVPFAKNKKFISIIAGKTLDFYRKLDTPYIVRFMPNLAAMYRKAAVGVSFPPAAGAEKTGVAPPADIAAFRRDALDIAAALGEPVEIPERLMPMMTGLSGSGIAFVFSFLHAMALGGVKTGLGYDKALGVALKVVEGAVEVVRRTGENPAALTAKVSSPAGTTIAGLQALEEAAFTAAVMRAVEEAAARAEDLEGA